MRFLNVR